MRGITFGDCHQTFIDLYDHAMSFPHPDSSEFAALMDFVATGGRTRDGLEAHRDPDALSAQLLAPRARAMTASLVTIAKAVLGRPG